MAVIVVTKNSSTPALAPTGLAEGELAVNLEDNKLYVGPTGGGNGQQLNDIPPQFAFAHCDSFGNILYSRGVSGVIHQGTGILL